MNVCEVALRLAQVPLDICIVFPPFFVCQLFKLTPTACNLGQLAVLAYKSMIIRNCEIHPHSKSHKSVVRYWIPVLRYFMRPVTNLLLV